MATAKRYTTGQQSIMVSEHRTAKRKKKLTTVAAQNSKHEFIPTTSNKNKVYESKVNPKLVNQQWSNETRIKNAKTRRAQERCFT